MDMAQILVKLNEAERAFLEGILRNAEQRGFERGKVANGWAAFFRGALQSASMWLGAAMAAYPLFADDLNELLTGAVGERWTKTIVSIIGIVIVIDRARATTSLEQKGAKPNA